MIEANDSAGQMVEIRYAPSASFASKSMRLDGELLGQFVDRNQRRLAGTLFTDNSDPDAETGGFCETIESSLGVASFHGAPFYTRSRDRSGEVGYDATTSGMQAGYSRSLGATTKVGLLGGYARSQLDFEGTGFDTRSENSDHYFGGLHASHRWSERFALSTTSVYLRADKEYSDASPLNNEGADYTGQGLRTRADAAVLLGPKSSVQQRVASLGLSHTWQERDAFTTTAPFSADVTYAAVSEHHFYLHAGLDWQREYIYGAWRLTPQAAVEVTHALGGNDFNHEMSVGSLTAEVADEGEKFHAHSQVGVSASQGGFRIGLGASTRVAEDSNQFSGWLSFSYDF